MFADCFETLEVIPTHITPIGEAIAELQAGRMIVIVDDEERENEGDVIIAAEKITPETVNFMATHARGLICLAITGERADALELSQVLPLYGAIGGTAFTVSIDAKTRGVTTGISAYDRCQTILAAIDPGTRPEDLARPGHVFPLRARRDGSGANARVTGDDEEMQRFVPIEDLFKGRHFDGQIIILCVAWYTSFKLSLRDLVSMMADRGISVTHTTILRWVQRYLPEFEKRWWRYARPMGGSWRMDETYIKVDGQWVYLYRAVDKAAQTVDFFLSRNRDVNAAKSFLRSAMKNTRVPTKITLDAYAASHRAVREMKEDGELPRRVKVRSSQYLNNLVEQDHRRVKQRIRPMLGFKRFDNAAVTISGIELAEKIKKGQYKTGKLGGRKATMSELWNAALAA